MNLLNVIYYLFATLFVLVATAIGCIVAPYIIYNVGYDIIGVTLGISIVLLVIGIIFYIIRRKKNSTPFKIFFPIVFPIFFSALITNGRFYYASSFNNYLQDNRTLYTKFGSKVISGRYNNWCRGYDDGEIVFINYSDKKSDRYDDRYYYYLRDIYDEDLNFIRGYNIFLYWDDADYDDRRSVRDDLEEDFEIMEW